MIVCIVDKVRVKLSGDGTCVGNVVNFTFTILDEGRKAHSADGNYCLAIFRQQESYDGMKTALSDIRREVENLTSIHVNDHKFDIVYFLGNSLPWLLVCYLFIV